MESTRPGDLQSCCRLCLCEKLDTLTSVFEDTAEDKELPAKISQYVGVEVREFAFAGSLGTRGIGFGLVLVHHDERLSSIVVGCCKVENRRVPYPLSTLASIQPTVPALPASRLLKENGKMAAGSRRLASTFSSHFSISRHRFVPSSFSLVGILT